MEGRPDQGRSISKRPGEVESRFDYLTEGRPDQGTSISKRPGKVENRIDYLREGRPHQGTLISKRPGKVESRFDYLREGRPDQGTSISKRPGKVEHRIHQCMHKPRFWNGWRLRLAIRLKQNLYFLRAQKIEGGADPVFKYYSIRIKIGARLALGWY